MYARFLCGNVGISIVMIRTTGARTHGDDDVIKLMCVCVCACVCVCHHDHNGRDDDDDDEDDDYDDDDVNPRIHASSSSSCSSFPSSSLSLSLFVSPSLHSLSNVAPSQSADKTGQLVSEHPSASTLERGERGEDQRHRSTSILLSIDRIML